MGPRFVSVIFDLDGTLVDSLDGINASARYAIQKCLPERAFDSLRHLVGPPVVEMFGRLWPDLSPSKLQDLVAAFRRHYDERGSLLSHLYPSVPETLARLRDNGVGMFVLTNKPSRATQNILQNLEIVHHFRDVISPDVSSGPFLAKHEGATFLRVKHNLEPDLTLVMGDGSDDLEAAEICGFQFLYAAYGYGGDLTANRTSSVRSAETFSQLLSLVL